MTSFCFRKLVKIPEDDSTLQSFLLIDNNKKTH